MVIDFLLVIIGLIWVLVASIFDIKTNEVPDWLSYSLIIIGLGLRLIHSLVFKQFNYILYGLLAVGIFWILGVLMYYLKQWGGGDSKLLIGLGAVFATHPKTFFNPAIDWPFLLILLINVMVVGAIYGIIWGTILAIKNKNKFLRELKKHSLINIKIGFIFAIAITATLTILRKELFLLGLTFGIFIILTISILLFAKVVEKTCMYKNIKPIELIEGDWVVKDIKHKGKLIYSSKKNITISKSQIKKLIKLKINKVLIKQGIPFVPSFLIGLIISLVFGNLLYYII